MTELERVIRALECCTSKDGCKDCPYSQNNNGHACTFNCISDALTLLKTQEQDSKKIIEKGNVYKCPWCGEEVFSDTSPNYCGYCGKPVKWE